jgi:D-3-phosphoglycerate dehydrogenase
MDINEIRARNIVCLVIAKEYDLINSFTATSEMAFGLLLALVRKIPQGIKAAEQGIWSREALAGFQLHGKTFGCLGLGRLGTISARIAQGFGMRVIAHDVRQVAMEGVEIIDFDTLVRESDVVSVHIHLRSETEGMINADIFSRMRSNAILLNTSRGRIIDEAALLAALQNWQIAGAGLDVIDGEWLSQQELYRHPLIAYARENDNLIIVPHIASSTRESIYGARVFMAAKMADTIRDWPEATS